MRTTMEPQRDTGPAFDTGTANTARIYDYLLGGKDNYVVDREAGDKLVEALPGAVQACRDNRAFLQRAVRHLAGAGIRQFLDIGTGLPTASNTHQVAQHAAPESRIVYVDNDPIVLAHARALLTSTPEGACAYIHADLRDPAAILAGAARTLHFCQPVGVLLVAVLHFLTHDEQPHAMVRALMDAVPPGSYLAVSHVTADHVTP